MSIFINGIITDQNMCSLEDNLSKIAKYPLIGIPAGGIKVLTGALAAITCMACAILALIPSFVTGRWELLDHCYTHIKHALVNIGVGMAEAIPLVGYFIELQREKRENDGCTRQWMPYPTQLQSGPRHSNPFSPGFEAAHLH
jgi:hypothetical protein